MDMIQAALTLQEIGHEYMLMPDHVPGHPYDGQGPLASAFAYGYITAVVQAVAALA
jgi:mannonate dehydratase